MQTSTENVAHVVADNGMTLSLKFEKLSNAVGRPPMVLEIKHGSTTLKASDILQMAEILKAVDKTARRVCQEHGDYRKVNARGEMPASCPSCRANPQAAPPEAIADDEP